MNGELPISRDDAHDYVDAVVSATKEVLGVRLDAMDRAVLLQIQNLQRAQDLAFDSVEKARAAYAAEIARRLAKLDKAFDQANAQQSDYLLREVADRRNEQVAERFTELRLLVNESLPRPEAKVLFDALSTKIDAVQSQMNKVATSVSELASSLRGQASGMDEAQRTSDRARTLVFALIGAVVAILSVFGLVHGLGG